MRYVAQPSLRRDSGSIAWERSKSVQIGHTLAQIGRVLPHAARFLAKFGRSRSESRLPAMSAKLGDLGRIAKNGRRFGRSRPEFLLLLLTPSFHIIKVALQPNWSTFSKLVDFGATRLTLVWIRQDQVRHRPNRVRVRPHLWAGFWKNATFLHKIRGGMAKVGLNLARSG